MKSPHCYIAGPMRGRRKLNFPAFFAAEAALSKLGWVVHNPARLDTEDACPHEMGTVEAMRFFARRDTQVILNMRSERGDAVVLLPDWKRSQGARCENALARWVWLRRVTLAKALKEGKVGR